MNMQESFFTALDSLMANKLRAVLTMLGVIIGVASVIALLAIGNGVSDSITGELSSIGTNLLTITTNTENSDGYATLSLSDVEALSDELAAPDVGEVAAAVQGMQTVVRDGEDMQSTVSGVTANYFVVNNLTDFASGDGLTENDIDTNARVAVIGYDVAAELFPELYAIGRTIKINGASYEVVGVLEESGSNFGNSDENVFIPISTAHDRLYANRTRTGEKAVSSITAQAVTEEQTTPAMEQITEILRDEHGIVYAADDDFEIFSQGDLLSTFETVTSTMTLFLGAIAGISLLVGGIGIMNIMLVSVTERTREIGIRKAVGALRWDIMAQFLLESILLSLLGGLIGIVFGWLIAVVAAEWLALTLLFDINTILLAVGFAVGVGLIFGGYPAWRASSLRPIEALRYE